MPAPLESSTFTPVPNPGSTSRKLSPTLRKVSTRSLLQWIKLTFAVPSVGITERQSVKKATAPAKRRVNQRGAIKVEGMQEFNPDANVRLTRKSEFDAKKKTEDTKKKGGCC